MHKISNDIPSVDSNVSFRISAAIASVIAAFSIYASPLVAQESSPESAGLISTANRLANGANSNSTNAFWNCEIFGSNSQQTSTGLRLWKDGKGTFGNNNVTWEVTGANEFKIVKENKTVVIQELAINDGPGVTARFEGFSNAGEQLNCSWSGPSNNAPQILSDDFGSTLSRFLTENSSNANTDVLWNCFSESPVFSTQNIDLQFLLSGELVINGLPGSWFIDESHRIHVETALERFRISSVFGDPTALGNKSFRGNIREHSLSCQAS